MVSYGFVKTWQKIGNIEIKKGEGFERGINPLYDLGGLAGIIGINNQKYPKTHFQLISIGMDRQRRTFLKQSGLAATALTVVPGMTLFSGLSDFRGSDQILKKLTIINDALIEELLTRQVKLPRNRWNGGVKDDYEVINTHSTAWFIIRLANSYTSKFSQYYLSGNLEQPMDNAMTCLLNVQHDDGTIDLHSTNFHSTPDTAFLVNYLSPVYAVLTRLGQPKLNGIIEKMRQFFRNSAKCLEVGGIHTANHRWVVCSALARINSFFPDQKYVDRIDEWLSEGIDMDPDGQYTERSVSIYSPTCDNMFLTMGRLLNRPELMDVVRKNLDMTLYYIQPGGEVLTDASGRQDNARIGYVNAYYYAYRYFAIKDKNPVYAAVCELIEKLMPEKINRYIADILEDPLFENEIPEATKIPDNYFERFEYSGVFRIRRGNIDISVIERNPTFMSFMKGGAILQSIRLAAAFFGSRGQFISEKAELIGNTIILSKSHTHGYYQPYPEDKRTGDGKWAFMPRTQRTMSELQTLNYRVEVSELDGKATIDIEIEGTPYVPVSLEMSFRSGGELTGVVADKNVENAYFLEKGIGQYTHGKDVITFGPGISSHKWAEIRGMLPKQKGKSVYLTGYTPFKHVIELS